MNFGKLDKKVAIIQQTKSKNDFGEFVFTQSTLAKVWAQIKPNGGDTDFEAETYTQQTNYEIYLRFRNDLSTRHYLQRDGVKYYIKSINEIGRKAGLKLECYVKNENA